MRINAKFEQAMLWLELSLALSSGLLEEIFRGRKVLDYLDAVCFLDGKDVFSRERRTKPWSWKFSCRREGGPWNDSMAIRPLF
jgi:hypothetical protein